LGAFVDRIPMLEAMAAWSIAVWFNGRRRVSCRLHTPSLFACSGTTEALPSSLSGDVQSYRSGLGDASAGCFDGNGVISNRSISSDLYRHGG
jgi:hypothetical protein